MNREEIRKKWKNRELAEISQKKLTRQEETQVSPTKQVSSWENVLNRVNQTLSQPIQTKQLSPEMQSQINNLVAQSRQVNTSGMQRTNLATQMQIQNRNNTQPITAPSKDLKKDKGEIQYKAEQLKKEEEQAKELASQKGIGNKALTKASQTLENVFQKPKTLYNGYQFGDITKTIGSTVGGIGSHIIGGVEQVANFIPQTFGYGMATISRAMGKDKIAEAWIKATQDEQKEREDVRNKIFDVTDKSSLLGKTGNQVAEGVGQSLTFGTVGGADKVAGGALTFGQGFGGGLQESYSKKDVEDWQAWLKATGSGIVSYLSENIFENMGYGGSGIDNAIKNKVTRAIESGLGKALARTGISALGEGTEEILESLGNTGVNAIINYITKLVGSGAKFDTEVDVEDLVESATIGFLSGGFGEGSSIFTNNAMQSNARINEIEQQTGKKLTNEEKQAIRNETLYNSETQQENEIIIDKSKLTEEQKDALKNVALNNNLSNQEVEKLIQDTLDKKINVTQQNQATTTPNNEILNQEQQTIQQEGKQAQNQMSQETEENKQEVIKKQEITEKNYENIVENAKYISEEEKNNLKDYIKNLDKNDTTLNDFKNFVNEMNNNSKEVYDNILNTTETYSTGRKEKYQKYLNSKTDYDNSALKNALDIIPANNQGRRTKEQWLNVAKQIGTEIANKSNQEIEEIAFRTWQDERPSSKESLNRQGNKFVGFNSDEWINAIYDSVNEQRQYSVDTEQQAENQAEQQENVEQQNQQPVEQTVREEKINLVPTKKIESEQTKQRKHYESIMKSSETSKEAKSIAKKLLGTDTYVPDSNKAQLERADQRIGANPDNELNVLTSKIDNGDRLNATDIAVSERLIEYYSKIGDLEKLETAIQNTALAGTQLGQSVQALSLINRQTPVGQVTYIERTIKKLNQEILNNKGYTQNSEGKILNKKGEDVTDKVELFDFTSEMQQKILNSNKDNIDKVLDEVYDELGNQVTKSTHQKIDSWRYFSMLANIRTHLRNIVGNFAMGKTQQVKNLISAGVEDVSGVINPKFERTKTLRRSDKITKEFAKNDIKNVASELGLNSNKYTAQNRLKDNMREFKSDALNSTLGKLYNLNNTLLEVEDGWGLKSAYVRAFSNYITANKLDVKNISDTNLRKARKYAINEAQEATFHQASALASAINQFSARSKVGKAITDSNLPFVKTPINVAKTGFEYNPAGLVYNSVKGIHDLNTGKITVNQYIDNISKGLTGTGISLLGYALAEAGIVKASGGDDDKEKYEKDRGSQAYSIKIGNNTYSLDWLAPVGIPFFVGVEAHEIINEKKNQKTAKSTDDDSLYKQGIQSATNILNAFATSMNPMAEMSMLSGLTSALRSFDQGVGMIGSLIANAGQSYINQFEPTLLKQVARVTDSKQRTTKSTATGTLGKAVDQTKNQIMAGIPGLRQKLPVATDIWGEELKNDDNITRRAFETFIAPYTRKDLKTSRLDSELNDLYDKTGETSIYPSKLKKDLTIDNETYKFTNEEYIKYSKDYGQNSYNILSNLVTSNDYQNLSDSDKQKAIEKAYEYAKEVNKVNYAKKINKEDTVETDALYNVMSNIPSDSEKGKYLVYLVETSGDDVKDTEKKSYLLNSNMKDSTKEVIYRNSLGKKDKLYNTLYDIDKVNINGYLDYSSRDIKSDPDEESNVEGDTIYGTKKINVANALNEISNLSLFDKLYIYGKFYKLDSNEKKIVDNGIKNSNLTQEEKDEAYKDLSKSNIIKYKDGTYKWK